MIEALIHYLLSKGVNVAVLPERLYIWKIIGGQKLTLSWAISKYELAHMEKELLFCEADERLREFAYAENAAIREALMREVHP